MNSDEKEILNLFKSLSEEDKTSIKSYLEFLSQKTIKKAETPATPLNIPRPENETVVGAIKRLKKTYPMLESTKLLNHASEILTSHLLKGKKKEDAIVELEEYFQKSFDELKS